MTTLSGMGENGSFFEGEAFHATGRHLAATRGLWVSNGALWVRDDGVWWGREERTLSPPLVHMGDRRGEGMLRAGFCENIVLKTLQTFANKSFRVYPTQILLHFLTKTQP